MLQINLRGKFNAQRQLLKIFQWIATLKRKIKAMGLANHLQLPFIMCLLTKASQNGIE